MRRTLRIFPGLDARALLFYEATLTRIETLELRILLLSKPSALSGPSKS